jgi:hypothetical protein
MNLVFVDRDSPESRTRRERVRNKLGLENVPLPRYHWRLSSDGFLDSDDVYEHLLWIFERIRSGYPLYQLLGDDFECWLSVFWRGNGTGGGPLITMQIAKLLTRHRVEMGIAFYVE